MKASSSQAPRRGRGVVLCMALASWLATNCGAPEPETLEQQQHPSEPVAEAQSAQSSLPSSCVVLRRGQGSQVEDALVNGDPAKAGNNYGASVSLTAGSGTDTRHALLKWDVGTIPPGSIVTSATASMRVLLYGGAPIHAHKLTTAWDESLVTWTDYPESTPSLPATVDFPDVAAGQSTYADLTQIVQDWVSGASENDGLLLERDDAAGLTVFASSEADDEDARPTLQVCYTAPPSINAGDTQDQVFTLPGIQVKVAGGTDIQVGGVPVTGPLDMPIQKSADPSQAPAGPLASDGDDDSGTIMDGTDFPILPVVHFGPSGATFNPPLEVTLDVPSAMVEPTAWLCDDTGNNCERRAGTFYEDTSVSPPQSKLYIEIDHFSNLVITNRYPSGMSNANNNPVMKGTVNVYYIWYGNWAGNSATTILTDLANSIGGSPYMLINTGFSDPGGTVSGDVSYGGSVNVAASATYGNLSLSKANVQQIVSDVITNGQLPKDANGVYFVLTAANVDQTWNATNKFCAQYCGWHTRATIGGANIKYSFVGNPATKCPNGCSNQSVTSPNGNPGADGMASTVAHELVETISDPDLNAWRDANGNENADKCAWKFGATYNVANGSKANVQLGARHYLIQQNWDPAKGICTMSAPQFSGCTVNTPNGTACDDGNECTQTDTCQGGVCVGGNLKTCPATDQCHNAGTCNTATGLCSNPAKANGTACNDSNGCTQTDTCQSGLCVGGSPKTCAAPDQCHNAGTCSPSTGNCLIPLKASGSPCNDGNACTATDTCQLGACVGSGSSCTAGSGLTSSTAGASCQAILASYPSSQSGVYWLKPGSGAAFQAYCDMTTDGGGWTLALAYNHIGGQNNSLVPSVVPQSPTGYSHMSKAQMQSLGTISEARFYCQTSKHARKIHFKTSNAGVISYFQGTGSNAVSHWQSGVTTLPGHSALLPAAVDSGFNQAGEDRMTSFPFYKSGYYHWGIQGLGSRWECDDWPGNASATTLHQIWVRTAGPTTADGLTPATAAASCNELHGSFPSAPSGVYWLDPTGASPSQGYCDMTTDGGGWNLVLAYNHPGGQNAALVPGVVPQSPTAGYSHMSTTQMQSLGTISEARLYCQTSAHARKIHFKSSNAGLIDYIRGAGSNAVAHWQSGTTALSGHGAFLPAAVDSTFNQAGEDRMTSFPLYRAYNYHWGIQGLGYRWECDDFPDSASATTLHQIWVRVAGTADGLTQATAATSCLAVHSSHPGSPSGVYWLKPPTAASAFQGYCDMTTDGGGWTLALAYSHVGGQNNALVPGVAPQSPTAGYSHMSKAQLQAMGALGEARLYCQTSKHARKIHFKTSNAGAINYLRGTGSNASTYWKSGTTALSGHTGLLPAAVNSGFNQAGEDRMTNFPFYKSSYYHWGIQGLGSRWECDDYSGNTSATTLHQVWVR